MKEIWVDRERCLHCLSCLWGCAEAHSNGELDWPAAGKAPPRPRLFQVRDEERPFVLMCRHCENAPCVEACMAAAITRDAASGVVTIDRDRCVGCWMCIMVCPFGAIERDGEQKSSLKCDRCPDREVPACVEACPTGALKLLDAERYTAMEREHFAVLLAENGERGPGK